MRVLPPIHRGGIPLVALHGFWGEAGDWAQLDFYLGDTFSLWAPQLPGHGPGAHPEEPFFWYALRDAFHQWAHESLPRTYDLLGYSLGGRIALDLTLSGALTPRSLILESARLPLPADEVSARIQHDAKWARRLRVEPLHEVVQDWFAQPVFESLQNHPHLIDELTRRRLTANPELLARSLETYGLGTQPTILPGNFLGPVLALTGEFDHTFSRLAAPLCAIFSNVQHVVIAGAGHNTHAENPQAFAASVSSFLTTLF